MATLLQEPEPGWGTGALQVNCAGQGWMNGQTVAQVLAGWRDAQGHAQMRTPGPGSHTVLDGGLPGKSRRPSA